MAYRKIQPTKLHNGFNFCADNAVLMLNNDWVEAIVAADDAGSDIEKIEGIVCPGFVNAHCHLELSYLKNKIPPMTGMVDFLIAVMESRNTDEQEIQHAIENAEHEMIQNGIVAIGDICNTTHTIPQKEKKNIAYVNFIEISGFVPQTATKRYEAAKLIQQAFAAANMQSTIVPHAPYSTSQPLYELIYNNESNISTQHYKESKAEIEFLKNGKGDMLKLYDRFEIDIAGWDVNQPQQYIHNKEHQIWVHSVYLNDEDFAILANNNKKYVCLCPNANLFIGNNLPDVLTLAKYDEQICIGTDSYASNNSLNILDELKTIRHFYPSISTETLLRWATANGAAALGISHLYGSFEKGKSGKFVILQDF